MVEIWLIFNLFIPFAEVLLHTYMDTLRWLISNDFTVPYILWGHIIMVFVKGG